jgi:hypothetical protein
VSDQWCKLNQAGMAARDELLMLLELPFVATTVKNYLKIEGSRNLDRIRTITPILNNQPVLYEGLREFFVRAIEKVEYIYRNRHHNGSFIDEALCQKLSRQYILENRENNNYLVGLRRYFDYCCCNDTNARHQWTIPNNLYDRVQATSPTDKPKVIRANNEKPRKDVEESLHYLNYKAQESDLRQALRQPSQCMAFSVVAPNNITQKWVMHRLLTKVTQQFKNSRNPFYIDLDTTFTGDDYHAFLKKLSDHVEVKVDRVLEEICNSNSLTILIVHQFRQFKYIQTKIVREIEKHLDRQVLNLAQPQIIIFWLDECLPCFHLNRESEDEPARTNLHQQRLKQQQDDLQSEWDERHQALTQLRKELIFKTDVCIKIELEKKILDREKELGHLEERLKEIEQLIDSESNAINSQISAEITIDLCELAGLERIDNGDVEDWINDYEKFYPFLANLRGETLGKQDWEWRDPRLILNRICKKLEVEDGMAEIEKLWKWNNAKRTERDTNL